MHTGHNTLVSKGLGPRAAGPRLALLKQGAKAGRLKCLNTARDIADSPRRSRSEAEVFGANMFEPGRGSGPIGLRFDVVLPFADNSVNIPRRPPPSGGELAGFCHDEQMADRVKIFIDVQNVYMCARTAFFPRDRGRHFTDGQFDPMALGRLLVARDARGFARELSEVRLYTGRPDSARDPRSYSAHMKQCARWTADGCTVIHRQLRYPPDFPDSRAQEKGVDVQLSIDVVVGAIDGDYDIAVVFSTDTDLRPAIEFVANRYERLPRIELAAWTSPTSNKRIPVTANRAVWCHYLDQADYDDVADSMDYTR